MSQELPTCLVIHQLINAVCFLTGVLPVQMCSEGVVTYLKLAEMLGPNLVMPSKISTLPGEVV